MKILPDIAVITLISARTLCVPSSSGHPGPRIWDSISALSQSGLGAADLPRQGDA